MSNQEIMSILRAFVHERVLDKLLDNKQPSAPTCGFYDAYTSSQCETEADYERKMIELNKPHPLCIKRLNPFYSLVLHTLYFQNICIVH